ncbi:MAG: hypothetical protein R6U15_00930 [Candidatus Izemoplasmatales bacterium]
MRKTDRIWLNLEMKKAIKMKAIQLNKKVVDIKPSDFGINCNFSLNSNIDIPNFKKINTKKKFKFNL